MRHLIRETALQALASCIVGVIMGFALIGGVWARMRVDETRIENAERAQVEQRLALDACGADAKRLNVEVRRLRTLYRGAR